MDESGPRLVDTGSGFTVSYQNRFLYSRRNPALRPESVTDNSTIPPESLVIVPSPILFYGFGKLLEKLPSESHVICVEADEELMAFTVSQADNFYLTHEKISVVRTSDPARLMELVDQIGKHLFRRVIMIQLTGGYALHRHVYDAMVDAVEGHVQQHWQNRMTLMHMGRLWIRNLFSNITRYWPELNRQYSPSHMPVVVAGAGESLERSLPVLRRLRGRYLLLAADTALPVLLAADLEPDAVIVLEAQTANAQDFLGHGNRPLTLICDLTSNPSTLGCGNFDRRFILSSFADITLLSRLSSAGLSPTILPPLGSVGVAAVEMAKRISDGPLLLTGLDFCYIPGKPHSRGAPTHIRSLSSHCRMYPPGWFPESMKRPLVTTTSAEGTPIGSDVVLISYGKNLAGYISGNDRMYDIRSAGYPLGIRVLRTDVEIASVFDNTASQVASPPPIAPNQIGRNRVLEFLQSELRLLDNFLELRKKADPSRTKLVEVLKLIDYVFADFPDPERHRTPTKEFLARCSVSALVYSNHIKKTISYLQ